MDVPNEPAREMPCGSLHGMLGGHAIARRKARSTIPGNVERRGDSFRVRPVREPTAASLSRSARLIARLRRRIQRRAGALRSEGERRRPGLPEDVTFSTLIDRYERLQQ